MTVYDNKQKISRKPLSGVASGSGGGKKSLKKCGGINNPTHYSRWLLNLERKLTSIKIIFLKFKVKS